MSDTVFGVHAVQAMLKANAKDIVEARVQKQIKNPQVNALVDELTREKISVSFLPRKALDDLCSGANHQGIVLICRPVKTLNEKDLSALLEKLDEPAFILILDNIQDPHNLGACLRTANAAGVHAVIAPKNKSVGITATVRKVACGAAETTPFIQVTNLARTMEELKQAGIWLTGTDAETEKTVFDGEFTGPTAIVIGSEGGGLRRLSREACDYLVKIPMQGTVESLNASVATAVCLYEVRRQRLS